MKHRILITTLALVAVFAVSSAINVSAEDQASKGGKRGGPHGMGLLPPPAIEKLKLTNEQQAKLKEISAEFEKEAAPIREKMKAAHDSGADKEKMKELFEQLMPIRKAAMEKVEQILTDEQKACLKKMREEHGKRGPGGPGGEQHGKKKPAPEQQ
jgi:Spy/CpxP family protein refolding chaperone